MSETWRSIPGFIHYEASDQGGIRSVGHEVPSRGGTRMTRGRVLRAKQRGDGYCEVSLSVDGKQRSYLVHRLVCTAFCGEPPVSWEASHGTGIRNDNRAANLAWKPHDENIRDSVRHGTHAVAAALTCSKGHPWSQANTYRSPKGGHRLCRTCRREWRRRRAA